MAALRPLDEQLFDIGVFRLIEPEQRVVVAVEDGDEIGFGHQGAIHFKWWAGDGQPVRRRYV